MGLTKSRTRPRREVSPAKGSRRAPLIQQSRALRASPAEGGGEHPQRADSNVREGGSGTANARMGRPEGSRLAERVGFEPTLLSQTAFRERHHQPLGHLSAREDIAGRPKRAGTGQPAQRAEAA